MRAQDMYKTDKHTWTRGLQSLVNELLKDAKVGST